MGRRSPGTDQGFCSLRSSVLVHAVCCRRGVSHGDRVLRGAPWLHGDRAGHPGVSLVGFVRPRGCSQNQSDSDVAVITATDIKYVAETWRKFAKEGPFNLEVFNATGILTRQILDERKQVFLG